MSTKRVNSVALDDRDEVEATVRSLLVDVLGLKPDRVAKFDDGTELFGALHGGGDAPNRAGRKARDPDRR
jgi:hypothetical protein